MTATASRWALALLLVSATLAAEAAPTRGEIRVRLLERAAPTHVEIAGVDGTLSVRTVSGASLMDLPADTPLRLVRVGDELEVQTPTLTLRALGLRIQASAEISVTAQAPQRLEPRRYQGQLVLGPAPDTEEALMLVNTVDLEHYVACVVSREYGFDDLEGSKAQAVLARTYALRRPAAASAAYDLPDHTGAQVYEGTARLTRVAVQAAQATAGQILTYRGAPIEAVYFSSSGGHTVNNEDVWASAPVPYLRGRPDPYDALTSPHTSWTSRVNREALLQALSRTYRMQAEGFVVEERSADGRVKTIQVLGTRPRTVPANAFRLLISRQFGTDQLRSTFFEVRRAGGDYVFEGQGFGHGVGMSQYGALAQSQQGRSYTEILSFYFEGTRLTTLEGGSPLLATPAPPPAADVPVRRVTLTTPPSSPASPPPTDLPLQPATAEPAPPSTTVIVPAAPPPTDPPAPRKKKKKRRIGW
ncbi:MAG: SpoIID/LytB domain-containing protein [Bacteroidota bacterium]